ncbi:MAG: ketoacyl-ACP synthase III [Verrucomicrobiales bacterium]
MDQLIQHIRVAGLAAAVPRNEEKLAESEYGTPEARARFVAMTGIHARRLCLPEQFCSDLAVAAAERLLDDLAWDRAEVENLILITQSPDLDRPSTACLIQARLGLPTTCAAFDINLGCSGYPYGLFVASKLTASRPGAKTLLLVGDAGGKYELATDRRTRSPLFGDAATATALEWHPDAAPMRIQLHTDGSGWNTIMAPRAGGRPGLSAADFRFEEREGEIHIHSPSRMQGEDVFNFTASTIPPAIRSMLASMDWSKESVDAFVLHQASRTVNDMLCKRIGVTVDRAPRSLEQFGNTNSATIPLTLVTQWREKLRQSRQRLILCGYGIGLSWGTVACEWDRIVCPELIEI